MINILILCTGNSARSILAEALFNARGQGRVRAWSAGSKPAGAPNSYALELLRREGHDISALRSKSWDEFEEQGAASMDAVITVCDSAASEPCPVFPGAPVRAHWGLADPAGLSDPAEARAAFEQTYRALAARIDHVLASEDLDDPEALRRTLSAAHDKG